jgi:mono/diheme cytochrome c family protein
MSRSLLFVPSFVAVWSAPLRLPRHATGRPRPGSRRASIRFRPSIRMSTSSPSPKSAATGVPSRRNAVLQSNCFSCHSAGKDQGGLAVDTMEGLLRGGSRHGPAIVAGNSDRSPLIQRIRGNEQPRMPMGGKPLADAEIDRIAKWIDTMKAPAGGPRRRARHPEEEAGVTVDPGGATLRSGGEKPAMGAQPD